MRDKRSQGASAPRRKHHHRHPRLFAARSDGAPAPADRWVRRANRCLGNLAGLLFADLSHMPVSGVHLLACPGVVWARLVAAFGDAVAQNIASGGVRRHRFMSQ